jgi:O-antigen/teichoic acid export membrane protein
VSYWLLNANTTVSGSMLVGTAKLRFLLWYTVCGALANVGLSIALVQVLGVVGVILGTVITYVVGFPIYMWYMMRILDLPARRWLREVVARTYPLLVFPAGVCSVALASGLVHGLLAVALVGIASLLSYWIPFAWVGLERCEREGLWRTVTGRLRALRRA